MDILAAGCDAGIRYDEGLDQDMVVIRIGPSTQRFATAASPDYLNRHGAPDIRMICSNWTVWQGGSVTEISSSGNTSEERSIAG